MNTSTFIPYPRFMDYHDRGLDDIKNKRANIPETGVSAIMALPSIPGLNIMDRKTIHKDRAYSDFIYPKIYYTDKKIKELNIKRLIEKSKSKSKILSKFLGDNKWK